MSETWISAIHKRRPPLLSATIKAKMICVRCQKRYYLTICHTTCPASAKATPRRAAWPSPFRLPTATERSGEPPSRNVVGIPSPLMPWRERASRPSNSGGSPPSRAVTLPAAVPPPPPCRQDRAQRRADQQRRQEHQHGTGARSDRPIRGHTSAFPGSTRA